MNYIWLVAGSSAYWTGTSWAAAAIPKKVKWFSTRQKAREYKSKQQYPQQYVIWKAVEG